MLGASVARGSCTWKMGYEGRCGCCADAIERHMMLFEEESCYRGL